MAGIILLDFKGFWYPTSNTPHLEDGVGSVGDCYHIYNFDGTVIFDIFDRDLGSGTVSWVDNNYVYYDGSTWNMVDGSLFLKNRYDQLFLLMGG